MGRDLFWVTTSDIDYTQISLADGPGFRSVRYKYPDGIERDLSLTVPLGHTVRLKSVFAQSDYNHIARFEVTDELREAIQGISSALRGLLHVDELVIPITGKMMFAKAIESRKGVVYTKVYEKDKVVDLHSMSDASTRPLLVFAVSDSRLNLSLSQMYVHEQAHQFPLARFDRCPGL